MHIVHIKWLRQMACRRKLVVSFHVDIDDKSNQAMNQTSNLCTIQFEVKL